MHEHVDEVVRWIYRHAHLFADRDERFVVEEHTAVVDALGRNERQIEIVAVGERASNVSLEMDDLGSAQAYYMDLRDCDDSLPAATKLPVHARLARHVKLICRSVPYIFGFKKACVQFRNVPDAVRA